MRYHYCTYVKCPVCLAWSCPPPVNPRGQPDGPISENAKDFQGKEVEEEEEYRIARQKASKGKLGCGAEGLFVLRSSLHLPHRITMRFQEISTSHPLIKRLISPLFLPSRHLLLLTLGFTLTHHDGSLHLDVAL